MLDAAPHRGPDGVFSRAERNAAFGYLSLEITPESKDEVQPLVHTPTGVMVVADLRLDNRADLIRRIGEETVERHRRELSARGRTAGEGPPTDAELVLIAYLRWEAECFAHLLGDFAIAIWDPRSRHLLLARDPMAMRALYYRVEPKRALFATEVKQILAVPGVERKINDAAVASHLSISHHTLDVSFFEGIEQGPAGSLTLISTAKTDTRRFWQFNPEMRVRYRDERDYAEHFRELFANSLASRLRTDKPVGLSMSGGMDSGSIAATAGWMREQGRIPVDLEFRCYCWAFSELAQCDERTNSSRITRRYHLPVIDIPGDDEWPFVRYPESGPDPDEPFFGVYQSLLDKTAAAASKDGVRVLFSGDRGDLLMGGGITDLPALFLRGELGVVYRELRYLAYPREMPSVAYRKIVKPLIKNVGQALLSDRQRSALKRLVRGQENAESRFKRRRHLNEDFIRRHNTLNNIYLPPEALKNQTTLKRYEFIFAPVHMKGMVWSDRTNNRFGVAFADPFGDRLLAEYILSIPQRIVNRVSDQKRLLRAAMGGIMPADAIKGAVKVSPSPLAMKGFRTEAKALVLDLLTESEVVRRGYVNPAGLKDLAETFFSGHDDLTDLWAVLSLETWLRLYWR